MRRILLLLAPVLIIGCGRGDITSEAVRLVKKNYRDCNRIIMVDVDTITLGDNLDYRIKNTQRHIHECEMEVGQYRREIEFYKKQGRYSKSIVEMYQKHLARADSTLSLEVEFLRCLDSLKLATLDIAGTPTAYQVCVAYNYPDNLVWIQLNEFATPLKISKIQSDMLLNPGKDMPGYLELLDKRYGRSR